jgi:hypothetical protein
MAEGVFESHIVDRELRICDLPNQPSECVRFCRLCSRFLPIDAFPKGPVRYLCKTHWTAQISECTKKRMQHTANATKLRKKRPTIAKKQPLSKLRSISILVDSKEDAKKVFGQDKVLIGLRDVETLIGCDLALRLIPSNPLLPLSASNYIICTKKQRQLAITLWKSKQEPMAYSQLLTLLELHN